MHRAHTFPFNLRILYLFRAVCMLRKYILYNKFNIPDVFNLMHTAHETFSTNAIRVQLSAEVVHKALTFRELLHFVFIAAGKTPLIVN